MLDSEAKILKRKKGAFYDTGTAQGSFTNSEGCSLRAYKVTAAALAAAQHSTAITDRRVEMHGSPRFSTEYLRAQ